MFLETGDGYRYDDKEWSSRMYKFDVQLDPGTYSKLLMIAHENGILTFDLSTAINFVIDNFPRKYK